MPVLPPDTGDWGSGEEPLSGTAAITLQNFDGAACEAPAVKQIELMTQPDIDFVTDQNDNNCLALPPEEGYSSVTIYERWDCLEGTASGGNTLTQSFHAVSDCSDATNAATCVVEPTTGLVSNIPCIWDVGGTGGQPLGTCIPNQVAAGEAATSMKFVGSFVCCASCDLTAAAESGSSAGGVVGGIIGALCFCACCGAVLFFVCRNNKGGDSYRSRWSNRGSGNNMQMQDQQPSSCCSNAGQGYAAQAYSGPQPGVPMAGGYGAQPAQAVAYPTAQPQPFVVQVPQGMGPGMQITVQSPNTGQQVAVVIPQGIGPGMQFQVMG